jgi:transposase-like protein
MSPSSAADSQCDLPAIPNAMVHVAVTPHPVVRKMQRNTYVCYTCKRTRTYMLPGKLKRTRMLRSARRKVRNQIFINMTDRR